MMTAEDGFGKDDPVFANLTTSSSALHRARGGAAAAHGGARAAIAIASNNKRFMTLSVLSICSVLLIVSCIEVLLTVVNEGVNVSSKLGDHVGRKTSQQLQPKPQKSVIKQLTLQLIKNANNQDIAIRSEGGLGEGKEPCTVGHDETVGDDNLNQQNHQQLRAPTTPTTTQHQQEQQQEQQQQSLPFLQQVIDMSQRFASAKEQLIEKLTRDYGEENFRIMFYANATTQTSRGRTAFVGGDHGWDRIRRKLVMKLLQSVLQKQSQQQLLTSAATADQSISDAPPSINLLPFIWATGGNSVAAGHGNLMNESYTAVLESAVTPLWESVGMSFVGRNYGSSGESSGPEAALCQQAKFGTDVDMLVWDYGVTDGAAYQYLELFLFRAALTPSRPAVLLLPREKSINSQRVMIAQALEQIGLSTVYMEENEILAVLENVPDTFGLSEEEINAMPEYVRSFKCDGQLESGDPYCGIRKFSNYSCHTRRFMVGWHPGWKVQAVYGILMTLFLMEALEDALQELLFVGAKAATTTTPIDKNVLIQRLAELNAQEDSDYQQVRNAQLPKHSEVYLRDEAVADDIRNELRNILYKDKNICHTAQLPAEIRYKGILTETEPISILDPTNEIKGVVAARNMSSKENDQMRLVEDMDLQQVMANCPVPVNFDHHDFYFVNSNAGWNHLTLPNDAELREYEATQPLKGVILICTVGVHQTMKKEDLHFSLIGGTIGNMSNFKVEMMVNGESVESLLSLGRGALLGSACYVLRKNDGNIGYVWKPDERGRFKISARVTAEADQYFRLSSFIIY